MLSDRTSTLLKESKFYSNKINSNPFFHFDLSIKDKKLTVYYQVKTNPIEDILREIFCIFLNNRQISRLKEITLREILNFLRDGHQELQLDSDNQLVWENSLQLIKSEVLMAYFHYVSREKINIDHENYLAKNQLVVDLFLIINDEFYLKSDYQFHYFSREFVYFYKNPKVVDQFVEEALEKYLSNLYQERIKLVAVKV